MIGTVRRGLLTSDKPRGFTASSRIDGLQLLIKNRLIARRTQQDSDGRDFVPKRASISNAQLLVERNIPSAMLLGLFDRPADANAANLSYPVLASW
jgi:hypothetical protein